MLVPNMVWFRLLYVIASIVTQVSCLKPGAWVTALVMGAILSTVLTAGLAWGIRERL